MEASRPKVYFYGKQTDLSFCTVKKVKINSCVALMRFGESERLNLSIGASEREQI